MSRLVKAKQMTKLHVLAAVEPTGGITPEEAVKQAELIPEKTTRRVVIEDYIPAFEAIVRKGYTQAEAAEKLVAMGCPFKAGSIPIRFRELMRERDGSDRQQHRKRRNLTERAPS